MSSVQFVIQPLPCTDDHFNERLRDVSDKMNKYGLNSHRVFDQLKVPVKEVVIGPNYIAILLENGKVFRVSYSINAEKLDLSKSSDTLKSGVSVNANNTSANKNSTQVSSRQLARSRARLMRTTSRSTGPNSGSRSTGVIIGGSSSSRPLVTVPATYVPEELISQAEVVLQGKSRNLIIRELQRTNLDVNLAVNNLLSRDDEEAEDTEEGGDNYVPEDLISMLDNGFHGDNNSVIIDPSDGLFSEEIFNYSSIRNLLYDRMRSERNQTGSSGNEGNQPRPSTIASSVLSTANSLSSQISTVTADREAFSRWRDRQYYGPRRWVNKDDYNWEKDNDLKKKESMMSSPIWISEELQPWPDKNDNIRFKQICCLYSELIGVSESGELHQWKWSESEPYKYMEGDIIYYHPKSLSLNITEKIDNIAANFIRCSVVTENNRVATWMDEQLGYLGLKLEHPPVFFSEFTTDSISSVYVCSLYTAVRTESNNVFWWGVLPFEQRRYLWDKFRTKNKKPFKTVASDISVGTQVIMKKCPIYQTGSIGFTCVNGIPKVGQLLNSVWDFNDICRFKILNVFLSGHDKGVIGTSPNNTSDKEPTKPVCSTVIQGSSSNKPSAINSNKETTDRIDMPPPPSPASSTCSDTGSVTSHKRTKRMAIKEECCESKKDEELWQLKDVVFVEDKVGPIGKVLKVDGDFVAVRFPIPQSSGSTSLTVSGNDDKGDDWQQCRLLRRDDIQIYKTAMTSRGPDWLQKQPKKINVSHGSDFQLLAMSVDTRGIHIVKKIGSKLHYGLYNLHNSKQEQSCNFPTDCMSFMGASISNISMTCNNDCSVNTSTIILRDGNQALYPLARDCTGSIKDPQWLDMPPVKSVAMTTISLALSGNNLKSKVCITSLLFEQQRLMPYIFKCDIKNAFAILSRLEKEDRNNIQEIIDERGDGCRNLLHACTVMCAPSSNKENDEKKALRSTSTSASSSVFSASPSTFVSSGTDSASSTNTISSSFPAVTSNVATSNSSREGRTVSLREMMNRLINTDSIETNSSVVTSEDNYYIPPWSVDGSNTGASGATHDLVMNNSEEDISKIINASSTNMIPGGKIYDSIQRREHATLILQQMCSSAAFRPYIVQLLSAKDAQGQTPFMLAVHCRAYEAGIILLNTILSLSEKDSALKDAMIFPPGSPLEQSPLYVVCYNDTCSFTWTGADHINQNIYECKTCGLTGSLCCCTECARVCHKGHDCKLKRTSPTAYCDCWEKCKCKALIAGNQNKRFALLCKLTSCTDLVTKFNSKGESILLFLIQTVGRQTIEQRQYRANSRVRNVGSTNSSNNASSTRKSTNIDLDTDMPEHDLEPPKFARKALERLLLDWNAVRAMIMAGAEKFENVPQQPPNSSDSAHPENYNIYMQTQNGSTLLDKFTHNLFVKCGGDHVDTLLATLVREIHNESMDGRKQDAQNVARRFVRSVSRVFVIFNLEKLPSPEKRKASTAPNKHILSCIKVFQALVKISIQELCEVGEALIAPVRLGVVRPTAPFSMSSSTIDNSDELFSVDPLAPTSSSDMIIESSPPIDAGSDQNTSFNIHSNYAIDGIEEALRDVSENDEAVNRGNNAHSQEEDILEASRNDEVMQDDESDNDFTFNDAETESDSDDNQSNQDAQRSVQTGATAGSESDDSGDSSPQDEDDSDNGETDDHSDDFNYADHQLERRNLNSSSRSDLAPQSMQWAIRSRDVNRSAMRVPAGSNLVFIDPMALRRSTVSSSSAVPTPPQEQHTMATTASNLARAFGIIVRQISELLSHLTYNVMNYTETSLKIDFDESVELQNHVEKSLSATWNWMFSIMDGTEAQLKFGAYLTNNTDQSHPLHPLNLSSQNVSNTQNSSTVGINLLTSSRRDFFTYCLSLMRAHSSEHRDALPVLDITALRHIAYVLDGFICYMRSDTNFFEKSETSIHFGNAINTTNLEDEIDEELSNMTNDELIPDMPTSSTSLHMVSKRHTFFTRSDSTLSLGCLAPEGFDLPLDVAIPLADKPHLLQPNSKREDLFANVPLQISIDDPDDISQNILKHPPTKLGFSDNSSNICIPNVQTQHENVKLLSTNENISDNASQLCFNSKATVDISTEDVQMESNKIDIISSRPDIIIAPNRPIPTDTDHSTVHFDASLGRTVIVRASGNSCTYTSEHANKRSSASSIEKSKLAILLFPARGHLFCKYFSSDAPSWNFLLGRWKLTLDLFGRVFMDDVGMEQGSVLSELRGFPVKEMRFRRHMEKLRNGQQRDLLLCKLDRSRDSLIVQTFKELNAQFGNQNRRAMPPLTFNRVKVTFKDEPGEGSGVARSFYTSISEALLASAKMPNLDSVQIGSNNKYGVPFSSILRNRGAGREPPSLQRRTAGNKILWRTAKERKVLNYDARPYVNGSSNIDNSASNPNDHLSIHLQQLGERLFPKINAINQANASKITGMLLEIPTPQLLSILSSEEILRQKVAEALEVISLKQKADICSAPSSQSKKMIPVVLLEQCQIEDNEPLFYSPGKRGFYTPRQGYGSFERINAFRNIGRLIGLCLLQNELLPLFLQRHVLKYILGRKIKFHDLAFFDPAIYESFRQLLQSAQSTENDEIIKRMELFFVIDLMKEEGGGSVELIPGGREVQVNSANIFDYIRRYTEYRLIKSQEKALEALREGVFDVLPDTCMNSFTAEDFRLLLNGVGDINVSTLISYTTFNDESSEGSDKLLKFKRWFWSIVEKMSNLERQDLVYFWTGSPALPASEEGFQPLPSVTIRPADDTHLPTANTCISRLYIPIYSSKSILRSKLLLAIKSKNFGFV